MIVPVVQESAWQERLAGLPLWQPPLARTVLLSPHPDDETLGAGGMLVWLAAKKIEVVVVAVTDGERAYEDSVRLGETREQEQTAALEQLGIGADAIHRLRLRDSGLHEQEDELVCCLSALVDERTHVVAPWPGDFHPDHEACGRAAESVARAKGAQLSFYFFWTWHRGTVDLLDQLPLVAFPLNEGQQSARKQALACHRSQLYRECGSPILPPHLLKPMERNFEVYLPS